MSWGKKSKEKKSRNKKSFKITKELSKASKLKAFKNLKLLIKTFKKAYTLKARLKS